MVIPRSVLRPQVSGSLLRHDFETLSAIPQVARAFFGALAGAAPNGEPVALTAALVRQSLGLTARHVRVIVPAGRAAVFDDGMRNVEFVDAATAARGGGLGLLLYFVATPTAWMVIPGALYGPRVVRQISFLTGWPDRRPMASA